MWLGDEPVRAGSLGAGTVTGEGSGKPPAGSAESRAGRGALAVRPEGSPRTATRCDSRHSEQMLGELAGAQMGLGRTLQGRFSPRTTRMGSD